jgi:hypothetical protein
MIIGVNFSTLVEIFIVGWASGIVTFGYVWYRLHKNKNK